MKSNAPSLELTGVSLSADGKLPLHQQLADQIRTMVCSGQASAGLRLPPSRHIASRLGVSRNTVILAIENLKAEGYLTSLPGSGTFISNQIPDPIVLTPDVDSSTPNEKARNDRPEPTRSFEIARQMLATPMTRSPGRPFQQEGKDYQNFPFREWQRSYRIHLSKSLDQQSIDPKGHGPLRDQIARHLAARRAIQTTEDRIIIFPGIRQALFLIGRAVLNSQSKIVVEDPGYRPVSGLFMMEGYNTVPQPADSSGLVVTGMPAADAAYVTPSWQIPTGMVMSLQRRMELLAWATDEQAWILEDDYDCEYRYSGYAQAAIKSIDTLERVIYLGTFNNSMIPSLKLAFAVLPQAIVEPVRSLKEILIGSQPIIEQAALADSMADGSYDRMMRRVRSMAQRRLRTLVEAGHQLLPAGVQLKDGPAGMHAVGWLPDHVDDLAVAHQICDRGVNVFPVSLCARKSAFRPGLLFHYVSHSRAEIIEAMQVVGEVLHEYC